MLIKKSIVIVPALVLLISITAIFNIVFVSNMHPTPVTTYSRNKLAVDEHDVASCDGRVDQQQLHKHTEAKGIICPIFRDEEGFLSEFIAYYQLHGMDHIRLYDDGSKDNGLQEVQPWIKSGFVSVESNISGLFQDALAAEEVSETWEWYTKVIEHGERIAMQFFAHNHCQEFAIANGFDYMFTLDIDEYMIPHKPGVTVMDAVAEHSQNSTDMVFAAPRVNFASTPHTVEPIDLLTIEAYTFRMAVYGQLNYFHKIQPKLYFYLKRPVDNSYKAFIQNCCDIHSCLLNCSANQPSEVLQYMNNVHNMSKTSTLPLPVSIFHYARSLEKYDLKMRTWATYNTMNYSLTEFLDRNLGRTPDVRASTRYACAVRDILRTMTKENVFLRRGDFWYRNVEFNRSLLDSEKVAFGNMKKTNITDFTNVTSLRFSALVDGSKKRAVNDGKKKKKHLH
mmetsp:Transcript_21222/g.35744  ORF Transcript_21222/g.35744 Transcript_21222/m.35744 type:complete len:451 (+) Transcript_21222:171-1523(+)